MGGKIKGSMRDGASTSGMAEPGPSGVTGGGGGLGGGSTVMSAYPRPDLRQLIPFKPKIVTTSSYHPVAGGVFPPPPAVSALMKLLPPPYSFNGPFVQVDALMDNFRKYNQQTYGS